tara:strand:- start:357 stop:782 length:426 start_codon:yes stop_codon:yes gene_type:complete
MNESMNTENREFKVFTLTIENLSIFYGIFLILWGIIISFLSKSGSFTSYIPSILGIPIFLFSFLSIKIISKKKMFMHIVVFFGIIILLGSLDIVRVLITGKLFDNYWADISKIMMLLTSLFFTIQCVRSFIHVRKNREFDN